MAGAYDNARRGLSDTFNTRGWRDEVDVYYRQRKSVWFVLAAMIALSAFWTQSWAWVAFLLVLAVYSALVGVRMGLVAGVSWAAWFVLLIEEWWAFDGWAFRAYGLWCIATMFLLVVWKADGVHQLRGDASRD